jgi:O-antigen biosynthesis protein WbqL
LVNFDEIELKLQALGFSTIEPETMSIAEQIQIFAGAEIVVGELSSALHNAMFSPAETIVVQLNPFNSVQRHLALSMQHILISITPDDGSVRSWPGSPNLPSDFTVRPDMIEKAIQIGLNMRKG